MPDDVIDNVDVNEKLRFSIGSSKVTFTLTDAAGNNAVCRYDVDVKGIVYTDVDIKVNA